MKKSRKCCFLSRFRWSTRSRNVQLHLQRRREQSVLRCRISLSDLVALLCSSPPGITSQHLCALRTLYGKEVQEPKILLFLKNSREINMRRNFSGIKVYTNLMLAQSSGKLLTLQEAGIQCLVTSSNFSMLDEELASRCKRVTKHKWRMQSITILSFPSVSFYYPISASWIKGRASLSESASFEMARWGGPDWREGEDAISRRRTSVDYRLRPSALMNNEDVGTLAE